MESNDKREQEQKGGKRAAEGDPQRKEREQDPNRPGGSPDRNPDRNRENERGDHKR